jgi:hypothetical protein
LAQAQLVFHALSNDAAAGRFLSQTFLPET